MATEENGATPDSSFNDAFLARFKADLWPALSALVAEQAAIQNKTFADRVSKELQEHVTALQARMGRIEAGTAPPVNGTAPGAKAADEAPPQSAGEKTAGMMAMADTFLDLIVTKILPMWESLQRSKQLSILQNPQALLALRQENPIMAQMAASILNPDPMGAFLPGAMYQGMLMGAKAKTAFGQEAGGVPSQPGQIPQPNYYGGLSGSPAALAPRLGDVLPVRGPQSGGVSMTQRPVRNFKPLNRQPATR